MSKHTIKPLTATARLRKGKGNHWHATANFEPSTLLGWPSGVPATRFHDDENGTRLDYERVFDAVRLLPASRFALNQRQVSVRIHGVRLTVSTDIRKEGTQAITFGPHKITPSKALEIINS